jgi:hypothetical protein
MNKIILDTNCYAACLSGDPKILQALTEAKITYTSIFVLGELYAGFKGGTREKKNLSILRQFLDKPSVKLFFYSWRTFLTPFPSQPIDFTILVVRNAKTGSAN